MNGLLGGAIPQQMQQGGGLLGAAMPQGGQGGGLPPIPDEVMQAIEQMKGVDPEQQQQFIQKIFESIDKSGLDQSKAQSAKQQIIKLLQS